MMENKKAIVIGAGVSGLSAAWELKKRGLEVIVLEKNANVGGVVSTFSENGYKAESGTNSVMVTSQKLLDFINEVGLESKMEVSKPVAKKRFFARYSKPRAVPMDPISLLFTRLFSFFGKIRIFFLLFQKSVRSLHFLIIMIYHEIGILGEHITGKGSHKALVSAVAGNQNDLLKAVAGDFITGLL